MYKNSGGEAWDVVRTSKTNQVGRCADLIESVHLTDGLYKLRFDVGTYYAAINTETFYPFVEVIYIFHGLYLYITTV